MLVAGAVVLGFEVLAAGAVLLSELDEAFEGAAFEGAALEGAAFEGAALLGAALEGAIFAGAVFAGAALFTLFAILLAMGASPPQAIPRALKPRTVESAITFFITEFILLSSSKIKF